MARGPFYTPGRYWGRVTHQKVGKTTKTDNYQLILQFVVIGKVNPADPETMLSIEAEFERTIFRVLTDNTIEWVMQDLDTLNWHSPTKHWMDFDEGSSAFVSIVGSEHVFRCDHETFEGTTREKWSVAGDGIIVKPLDDTEAKQLEALFGRHLQVRKKPVADTSVVPKPAPVVPPKPLGLLTPNEALAEAGPTEDSIPF